jgi:hypothetical protein
MKIFQRAGSEVHGDNNSAAGRQKRQSKLACLPTESEAKAQKEKNLERSRLWHEADLRIHTAKVISDIPGNGIVVDSKPKFAAAAAGMPLPTTR